MSDNIINCGLSTLTPTQLIKSLAGIVSDCYGVRLEAVNLAAGCANAVSCDTWGDVWQLFLTCIGTGGDGKAVLRAATTAVNDCNDITSIPCDLESLTPQQVASMFIGIDTDGNYCLKIFNINC
jgi:hypothetical protein